jgi:peptide deformylase
MAVEARELQIVCYPHPTLLAKAEPVPGITDEVRAVAHRMLDLMHAANGVGLAAPQVALSWRLFVANPSGDDGDNRVYINPVLRDPTALTDRLEEGCLSLPDIRAPIMRPVGITIEATDLRGNRITDAADDLTARIWQHETDHLDGILILDRMTKLDKQMHKQTIAALEAAYKA